MCNSFEISKNSSVNFVRYGLLASLAGLAIVLLPAHARADTFEEIASEDAVIASGLPDLNMEIRQHSNAPIDRLRNMLMFTWDGGNPGNDYDSVAAAAASQEYMIFKFDFSNLPEEATITSPGDFSFTVWYTHCTDGGHSSCAGSSGPPHPNTSQEELGLFDFYEISAGDANWEDNQFSNGSVSPGAVTFNNLGGTFTKLDMVTETAPIILPGDEPGTSAGGPIVPGELASNGDFSDRQRLTGIPIATLERLRSGQSVGLAMGSIPDIGLTNFSIHSSETFIADQEKDPRLIFDFTTDVVLDPADFDGDGDVDDVDLATWQGAYGSGAGGDTDSDGDSDGTDFLAWQKGYTGAGGAATAVPEPTTMCLVCLGGLAALGLRRRRSA